MPEVGERISYLGIDPGSNGGLVCLRGDSIIAAKMPDEVGELWEWISSHSRPFGDRATAVVELVGGYIGRGYARGSHMFNFGVSYGSILMALTAARIPFETVRPSKWMKYYGLVKSEEEKDNQTKWKNRIKQEAVRRFPKTKITLATADAILLADYCRRRARGIA